MRKTKVRPIPKLEVPQHFQVTEGELAVLSRLVRVMRMKDERGAPWLGPFIEWLLYREATEPNLKYQSSQGVFEDLKRMGGDSGGVFASSSAFIKAARRECPGITFVSPMSAVPDVKRKNNPSIVDALPVDEENQFYQILRMWRMEYPAPPTFPKGRTQHESDPDSD